MRRTKCTTGDPVTTHNGVEYTTEGSDDPGKRIASVVPGDPAYLVTADGARYFVGAMLPTGHRITRIDGQHVTLERGGEESTLNF